MVHAVSRLLVSLVLLTVFAAPEAANGLPRRSLAARPLPAGVLAAAQSPGAGPPLSLQEARALTDTLLAHVSAVRALKKLHPVPVLVSSREQIRTRLEEITKEERAEERLRQDEQLLKYLGLMPADQDLVKLYQDLLEEQLAGFYDIDKRELVLADWIPRDLQTVVADHELTHALQDQHFSLRVRKKLGFDTPDAEAAWSALIEGDASAVMAEMALAPQGKSFTMLADSAAAASLADPAAVAAATGLSSERFLAAPEAVRSALSFPYLHGLRFVAQLYKARGWKRVDEAYIHPPVSTEQILHPSHFMGVQDGPVRLEPPDLAGVLRDPYKAVASGPLGEYDIYLYLKKYVDDEIANVSAEGWAGAAYTLYKGGPTDPPVLVLVTKWDSEDDAVEFYGGVIGALETRFPQQKGYVEASSQDQILWKLDADGTRLNALRLNSRQVICIENVPEALLMRMTQKLDTLMKETDPTPEVRSERKEKLPWNVATAAPASGALTLRLPKLPDGWTRISTPADSEAVLEAVREGGARLEMIVDRKPTRAMGLDGYTHALADQLHKRGKNIYVQTDVNFPRKDAKLYQHVFTQIEADGEMLYCLGVADLEDSYGYILMSGNKGPITGTLQEDFYRILQDLQVVPVSSLPAKPAPDAGPGASSRSN